MKNEEMRKQIIEEQRALALEELERCMERFKKAMKENDRVIKGIVEKMILNKCMAFELVGIFTEEDTENYKVRLEMLEKKYNFI